MSKLNLSKQKIIILAVSAVVVIAGAIAAVALIRNFDKKEDTTTTATVPNVEYVEETYFETVPVVVTDEDHSAVTDNSGNAMTSIQQIVRTTRRVATKTTTKKNNAAAATTKKTDSNKSTSKLSNLQQYLVDNALAGYKYHPDGYYYTDDKDCWQKNAGYNEIYDNLAPAAGMPIDQIRIHFDYAGKEWMIQFWKGQYGWLFVGAEIGVYTAPLGTYSTEPGAVNHFNCADEEDWLKIQLDCYFSENDDGHYKKIFTREYDYYWWATGFVPGQLTNYTIPKTELKTKNRITFKSTAMADAFVKELRNCGFVRAVGSDQLVDDSFYQSGADVWVLWSTIYHDAFENLADSKTTTKATTTKPTTTKATTTKATTTTTKPTTTEAPTTTTTKATTTEATTTTTTSSEN